MAGQIIVSSIKTDSDNSISFVSNTGATIFSANLASGLSASSFGDNTITSDKIVSVANTKIAGNIVSSQITSVANTQLTGTVTSAQVGSSVYEGMGMRNRIINGDMRIDQRNAGAGISGTGGNKYAVDRWRMDLDTSPTITIQQSTTAPTGFNNSYFANITGAGSAPTSGQANVLVQKIEGFNTADLGFGTASAKTVTLSFWVRSSVTGTFGGNLNNSAGNRSYVFQYTVSLADTWEYKTITIVGDTTGTWVGSTNGIGIVVSFDFGSGSGSEGTASAWQSGYKTRVSGNVNLGTQASATFYITGVQLEVGSVATPFERRPYGTELSLCQRYYWKIKGSDGAFAAFSSGLTTTTTTARHWISFPVSMRSAPTITYGGNIYSYDGTNLTVTSISTLPGLTGALIDFTGSGGGGNVGRGAVGYAAGSSTDFIQASIEL